MPKPLTSEKALYLLAGFLPLLAIGVYLVDKNWTGEYTVYFDDCRKKIALMKRLDAAGMSYKLVEFNGVSLGEIDPDQGARQLGLSDVLAIPPDADTACQGK